MSFPRKGSKKINFLNLRRYLLGRKESKTKKRFFLGNMLMLLPVDLS
jgi:hypothetical protein